MSIQTIEVSVKGKTPLLMHRFPIEPVVMIEKKSPEEQAEIAAYRDPNYNNLYVPGINILRALIAGAVYSKGKGRASLQKQAAACLFVTPERVSLGVQEYEIDSRPVVVPATRGRIVRHRPRLDTWEISFVIEFDASLLKETEVRKIVDDTFDRVGILDFRPEKKGFCGRGMVVKWDKTGRAA